MNQFTKNQKLQVSHNHKRYPGAIGYFVRMLGPENDMVLMISEKDNGGWLSPKVVWMSVDSKDVEVVE
jgi:hypothetical protein